MPCPTTVVYPGFSPEQATGRTGQVLSPPVVGMIGRISPTKGQLEFVRATPRRPGGHSRRHGSASSAHRCSAPRTTWRRCVPRRSCSASPPPSTGWTSSLIRAANWIALSVFVHASPVPEPFGQVIVEAMIRGVPVVATGAAGVSRDRRAGVRGKAIVRAEPLGLLVDPGDVDALSRAMCSVLSQPDAANSRADRAWISATNRFAIAPNGRPDRLPSGRARRVR